MVCDNSDEGMALVLGSSIASRLNDTMMRTHILKNEADQKVRYERKS